MTDTIRVDKFLWFARLVKSRSLAQEVIAAGRMRIAGRVVDRAHLPVHAGDVLTFPLHGRVRVIRVEAIPGRRGPNAEARACYADLSPPSGFRPPDGDGHDNRGPNPNENVSQKSAEY